MKHQRCRRQRSVFRRLQRLCERCRESRGTCPPVYGTFFTVRENGVPNAVAPPKVSQRRAQPCAAVRRRIDTASSSAMIVLMCSLALCDQAQRMTARRKRFQVAQNQTWGCLDRRRCRDDVRERL